jgi:hypothetical protein
MDFAKFVSLLETRTLFFASSDRLGDPYEGTYPSRNLQRKNVVWPNMPRQDWPKAEEWAATERVRAKAARKYVCISCWYESAAESDAMWKLYSVQGAGIAIQTTFADLCTAMEGHSSEDIYAGKVKYIEYATTFMPEGNAFSPYLHKRLAFEHEREVRAVVWIQGESAVTDSRIADGGVAVSISPERLIRSVVVSPLAPPWFHRLVNATLVRYALGTQAKYSQLAEPVPY